MKETTCLEGFELALREKLQQFHGAALLFLVAPVGLTLARALDIWIVTPTLIITVFPVAFAVYYLAWKHSIGLRDDPKELSHLSSV